MGKKIITISSGYNRCVDKRYKEESDRHRIKEITCRWSINNLIELVDKNICDHILFFCEQGSYEQVAKNNIHPKISLITSNNRYFLLNIDSMLFGALTDRTNLLLDEDYLFSTHMDFFLSTKYAEKILSLCKSYDFIAGGNEYLDITIGDKKYPWYSDQCCCGKVGWLRKNKVIFSWGPITSEKENYYLDLANDNIKIYHHSFMRNRTNKFFNFDGLVEGSLRIACLIHSGKLDNKCIHYLGDANKVDMDKVHLKSFFAQKKGTFRNRLNMIVLDDIGLGDPSQTKDRIKSASGQRGDNPNFELKELYNSVFYHNILNNEEKKRFNVIAKMLKF